MGQDSSELIGDDCAVIGEHGEYVFSIDSIIENTHFDPRISTAYQIGWKTAAVNISDVCAMGAKPLFLCVSLAIPKSINEYWIEDFYSGIKDCSASYGNVLTVGGDLCHSETISISGAILGKSHEKGTLLRSGAKPGYKVCVTGKFGNSGSFFNKIKPLLETTDTKSKLQSDLERLREEDPAGFDYFFKPKPRLRESESIWKNNSEGALMDASDGLAACLLEISEQSHLKLNIDSSKIPKDEHVSIEDALYGGEDFELVGVFSKVPEGFTEIGNTEEGMGINLVNTSIGYLSKDKLFRHF